jgi:UDP:flavonoid glycosyltransferase YjiC (YdhE family)
MRLLIILIVIALSHSDETLAANILAIFPAPSYSHTIASKVLTRALADRGHNIYLITTDPRPMNHPNITQVDLSFSYKMWEDGFDFVWYKENSIGVEVMIESFASTIYEVLIRQLNSTGVQYLINNRDELKFDLVIIEAIGFLPYHAFAEIFNAPLIGFNSFDAPMEVHLMQGNFVNPFVVNEAALFPYINHRLRFWQRMNVLKTFAKIVYTISIRPDIWNHYITVTQRFFPMIDATPLELLDKIEFLMINTHPALGFVRPLVPTTIQLGFIHIEDAQPLPNDLQRYLDNSKNGVIYMSLGSNVKSSKLNKKFVNIFLRVFESLDYDVIWKWEANSMDNRPENVMIAKWLPVSFFFVSIFFYHLIYRIWAIFSYLLIGFIYGESKNCSDRLFQR